MTIIDTPHIFGIGLAPLPPGTTPCHLCGEPQPGGADREFRLHGKTLNDGRVVDVSGDVRYGFSECARCADLSAQAMAIVESIPRLRAIYGSPRILSERLTFVLVALILLDQAQPVWDVATVSAALGRLESVGHSMSWSGRYTPVKALDAHDDEAAQPGWAFVGSDIREEARRQGVELMIDLMPPRRFAHPTGAGCALCSVNHVDARRREEAWHDAPSGKYGGLWFCRECSADAEGRVTSQALMETALFNFLDPGRKLRARRFEDPILDHTPYWADTKSPPSETRFGHIRLDTLRKQLADGTY